MCLSAFFDPVSDYVIDESREDLADDYTGAGS